MERTKQIRYYYELQAAKQELERWPKYKESKEFGDFYAHICREINLLKAVFDKNPVSDQEVAELGSDLVRELLEEVALN